jgi:quercetin dioxygenase-like cupin family protein
VRVLRIKFGPHDKSKQHDHPNGVSISFAAGRTKITTADGKTRTVARKAGEAVWLSAERHVVENPDAKPLEILLVELK